MSTPSGEDGFLYELEVEVREELRLTETISAEEAGLPVEEWLSDPEDAERDAAALNGLLGAVQAMEEGRPKGEGD